MWTIKGFNENRAAQQAKKARMAEHAKNMAVANRDVMGPAPTAKGRRKDLNILKSTKPPVTTGSDGKPFAPIKPTDTVMQGDSKSASKRRKALPNYNATRPIGQR